MIWVCLPMPPSANKIWRRVGNRTLKSSEYRRWCGTAAQHVRAARRGETYNEPVVVHIRLKRLRRNSDLDNRIKPILDALQEGGLLTDDNLVVDLRAAWDCTVSECVVGVETIADQRARRAA